MSQLVFFICSLVLPSVNPNVISLEGVHRFCVEDQIHETRLFASPEFDDSRCYQIQIPGSWQSQDIPSSILIGWYRIRFNVSSELIHPAVLLGRIWSADEVYLNGVKIGDTGKIGDQFVENMFTVRLYRIPKNLLKYEEQNLITVRVMNTYRSGGIVSGPVNIGEYIDLIDKKHEIELVRKYVEFTLFIFYSLSLIICLSLYSLGVRAIEYRWFALFIAVYLFLIFCNSIVFYETGLKTPFIQRLTNALSAFLPLPAMMFIIYITKYPLMRPIRLLQVLYLIISGCFIFPLPWTVNEVLLKIWFCLLLVTAVLGIYFTVRAYIKKISEYREILIGFIALITGAVLESVDMMIPQFIQVIFFIEYGMFVFLCCMMYTILARHSNIQKELRKLSGRILESHEQERKRISRELHDGIGQSMLGVKLHLQMLHAKPTIPSEEKEILSQLISQVSDTINDIRQTAMDLRPAALEKLTLLEALKWQSRKFSQATGIHVEVSGTNHFDLNLKIKDHLYRICQEAFSNIKKHSSADHVKVTTEIKGNRLYLTLKDNGVGCDYQSILLQSKGLGLSTMRERAELLGGSFLIQSTIGQGTTVVVEIPIEKD